jgi:hypothetical protein
MQEEVSHLLKLLKMNIANTILIAVTPDEAAQSLASFIEGFDINRTGEFWAPRGPK